MASHDILDTCGELVDALNRHSDLSDEELATVIARAEAAMKACEQEERDLEEEVKQSYKRRGRAAAAPTRAVAEETATAEAVAAKGTDATEEAVAVEETATSTEGVVAEEAAMPAEGVAVEETVAPTEVAAVAKVAVAKPAVKKAPAPRERRPTTVPKNLQIDMKVDESDRALGRGHRAKKPKKMFGDDEPLAAEVKGKRKRVTATNGEDEAGPAAPPRKRHASAVAVATANAATSSAPPPPSTAQPARKIRAAVSPSAVSQRVTRAGSRAASKAPSRAVSVASVAPVKKRGRPAKVQEEVEVAAPPAKKARKVKEREKSVSAPAASSAGVKKGKAPAKLKGGRSRHPAVKKGKGNEGEREEEGERMEGVDQVGETEQVEEERAEVADGAQRVGLRSPTIKLEVDSEELYS